MVSKTLTIFDFDDTLFTSDARVAVIKGGKKIKDISSGEYASYQPDPDETFGYEQFQIYPPNPRPISSTISALRSAVLKNGIDSVVIVTARSSSKPVEEVLEIFGMPPVEIIATGSPNSKSKADFVEQEVRLGGYDRVVVYEDNLGNIEAIKERSKALGVEFEGFRVMNHGERIELLPEVLRKLK